MDPVTIAVVRGALEQVADELDMHLIRAAISPIISEMNDCANGLFHARTGETIAQGQYGLPVFLANMQLTVQNLIPLVEAQGGFRPGDVWIVNDPYFSGTHLSDICLVSPYFVDGELFALFASTGHWSDIGGAVPGGWAPRATEIFHEGVFIPPVKLYEGGRRNDALVRTILSNLRLPHEVGGDLAAMVNVGHVGRRRMDALITRFGKDVVAACIEEMMERSEQQMRSHIGELPQGTCEFEDFLDNDGLIDEPIRFRLRITVTGSDLEFDFTGTDPRAKGPLNLARTTTISTCYVALKHVFPEIPVNGGTFRPTRFIIPPGCALAAEHPTPVGGYLEMVGVVLDLVFGALVNLAPERVPAAFYGTTGVTTIGGRHPETRRYFAVGWPYAGGYGGSMASDGLV
ncbi:MAG: hydantoinase B/oxoprolinase family protein, partial [Aldersonia sp.]|nr:hydantoinase B/oxoprolinase family protein [Aldersonia sp.]